MTSDLLLPDGTVIPEEKRQPCEVFSRIIGYLRPVAQWNKGKQAEWPDRVTYIIPKDLEERNAKKRPRSS